jgi:hypothetical protein
MTSSDPSLTVNGTSSDPMPMQKLDDQTDSNSTEASRSGKSLSDLSSIVPSLISSDNSTSSPSGKIMTTILNV